jgi:type IV pilus assembly protein PilX
MNHCNARSPSIKQHIKLSARNRLAAPRKQQGATLVVVLVLLLVMTLLGLASLRNTVLEERMTANLLDRSISFQSAESALRDAEAILASGAASFPGSGCNPQGLCARPLATATDRWRDAGTTWVDATAVDASLAPPEYFIELLGDGPNWAFCDREVPANPNCLKPRYRITARSTDNGRASVMLQTTFAGN